MSFGDIERVYVWDHRLLRREWVPLSRFTVLVGQNDTGKSTLLDAVEQLLTGRANVGEGSACVGWLPTPGAMQPAPEGAYVFRGHRPPAGGRPLAVEDERVHRYVVYDAECSLVLGETDREVLPRVHCIRLDLGDRTTAHQIVTGYLRDLAFRLLREPPGWEESDLRPFSGRGEAVARWVRDALDELAAGTYKLLPAFIRRRYREVVICIDTSELDDRFTRPLVREEKPGGLARLWLARVSLKDRVSPEGTPAHDFEQLASGVRPWLLAALYEQSRRLLVSRVMSPRDGELTIEFERRPLHDWRLYLIDEPERHLHPTAQVEVARWLHDELTDSRSGVVMATHSPAFLDLPAADVQVVKCWAADDESGRRARLLPLPTGDRLAMVQELAEDSGLRPSDLFLTGTVPIIVEGKDDRTYVRAAWRSLFGEGPEAAGVHVVLGGGQEQIGDRWKLLHELYPTTTIFYILVDCENQPRQHKEVDRIVSRPGRVTRKFALDVGDITLAGPEQFRSDVGPAAGKGFAMRELERTVLENAAHVHPTVAEMLQAVSEESLGRRVFVRTRPVLDIRAAAARLAMQVDELLTVDEVARGIGIDEDEVLRRIARSAKTNPKEEHLVAWRCGWRWWVPLEALESGVGVGVHRDARSDEGAVADAGAEHGEGCAQP